MTYWQKVIKYCAMAFAIFLTISIIGGIIGAVSFISLIFDGRDVTGEMQTYNISGNITELDIDVSVADLEIKTDDQFRVESNHSYLKVKEKDGKLQVSEEKFFWRSYTGKVSITIFIPKNTVFEKSQIKTGAGRVSISEFSAESLRMELGAGMAVIDSLTATDSARIEGGAGKITINGGALNNLNLDMGVGQMNLTSRLTGDCDLDYGIGETDIALLGKKEDYRIKINKGLGKISIGGKNMSNGEVYGSGEHNIEVDGGIGKIGIKFASI